MKQLWITDMYVKGNRHVVVSEERVQAVRVLERIGKIKGPYKDAVRNFLEGRDIAVVAFAEEDSRDSACFGTINPAVSYPGI